MTREDLMRRDFVMNTICIDSNGNSYKKISDTLCNVTCPFFI